MNKAIVLSKTGDPEELTWKDWELGSLKSDDVKIRHTFSGINFIDTYFRSGIYKPPSLPMVLGREGVGVVEEIGSNVTEFNIGDRVCYVSNFGAYSERNIIEKNSLIHIPKFISDELAAAMMLKGMTAQYLVRQTFKVNSNTTLLYQAAAGGVGLIACQWAKYLGATVIGTVGSDLKKEIALSHGCDHVINYNTENLVESVRNITGGNGVDYICDGVGAATYEGSIQLLKHHGTIAIFGAASGVIYPEMLAKLPPERYLIRTTLPGYTNTRKSLLACATDLFNIVQSGSVKININQRYNIKDAAKAHFDLENRKTTGSSVLYFNN